MRRRVRSFAVPIAALLLAAACSSSGTSPQPGGGTTAAAPSTPAEPPVTTAPPGTRTHTASSGPGDPAAHAAIAAAIGHAKRAGKRVLIDFGAGWCVDCRVLDTIFERNAVAPTVHKNYVVVHVDVHNFNFNMDISRKYGNACKGGIPALVVLDGKGTMLVSTSDGSFEHARAFGNSDVLKFLNKWAP